MFSIIKSIIKTLSIFSLFATIVVVGLSNVNASAQTCPNGYTPNGSGGCVNTGSTGATGTTGTGGRINPNICGGTCPLIANPTNAASSLGNRDGVSKFILNIANFFIYIAAAISVLFIVYGGYNYIVDGGDEKRSATGKKILINALIGLAVCILAVTIVALISGALSTNVAGTIVG